MSIRTSEHQKVKMVEDLYEINKVIKNTKEKLTEA